MSCYEWERGEVRLPKGVVRVVRAAVVAAYNTERLRVAEKATRLLPVLLAEGKGKRAFSYENAIRRLDDTNDAWAIIEMLMPLRWKDGQSIPRPKKPRKPKKKDIGLLGARTTEVETSWCSVIFRGDCVVWDVGENNRAREHARASAVGRAFFRALRGVQWTRGSGGEIVGNDEYNRDSRGSGEGSNYVIEAYGTACRGRALC